MLTPGLAKLFEPLSVVCAATHSVKILRNKGMVIVRQGKPIHIDGPLVAGIGSQREPDAAIYCTTRSIAVEPISAPIMTSAGTVPRRVGSVLAVSRISHRRFGRAAYLDRFHGCTDGDFACNCAGV